METFPNERELAAWAIRRLREILPPSWEVVEEQREIATVGDRPDAILALRTQHNYASVIVEAKASLSPKGADTVLAQLGPYLTKFGRAEVLVVAPSLSPRTQERLRTNGWNYLDQDGNVFLNIESPTVFVQVAAPKGAAARAARSESALRLSSATAARVVRTLVDCTPPLTNGEIAQAATTTAGYVSKVLDGLDNERLVTKGKRGSVVDVDWEGLLRRWAAAASQTRSEGERFFIARAGAEALTQSLRVEVALVEADRWAISASFAARELAPITAPTMLSVFVDDLDAFAARCGLISTDGPIGADVRLVPAYDRIVWARRIAVSGLWLAPLAEIVADSLQGAGRAPAEGEALLRWMRDKAIWRREDSTSTGGTSLDETSLRP